MKYVFSVVFASTVMMGCSNQIDAFYNREVIEDDLSPSFFKDSKIGTLAVTAQRRIVVANLENATFCAEPPPEAVSAVTDAIAAALTANIGDSKQFNAELAANFSKHVNQIYNRSQSVQIFRDYGFYKCVDNLNKAQLMANRNESGKTSDKYKSNNTSMNGPTDDLSWAFDKSINLLKDELEHLYKVEEAKAKINAQQQDLVICESSASSGSTDDNGTSAGKRVSTGITCKPLVTKQAEVSNELENKPSEKHSSSETVKI